MQVDVQNLENNKCFIKISLPKTDVDKEIDAAVQSIRSKVDIPGFRKGHAPLNRIKDFYKKHVWATAGEQLVYQGTASALKEKKLKNVSNPVLEEGFRATGGRTHLGNFNLDGTFNFAITVELPPEIDVKEYTGVKVNRPSAETSFDNWFKTKVNEQRRLHGNKISVNRSVIPGDEVVADFSSSIDGQPLDNGSASDFHISVGSRAMPEAFESSFIGKNIADNFDVEVAFPDNFDNELFKGKKCQFNCTVKEVFDIVLHDLNDEFAVTQGHQSLEDMKKTHREMWEQEFAEPMRAQLFNAIMEKVLQNNPFAAPQAWIDKETNLTINRLNAHGLRGNGQAMNAVRTLAERTVKIAYILDKIYEKETSIQLSPDDFMAAAAKEGEQMGLSAADVIQRLKDAGQYEGFVVLQEQERVVDFLVKNAVIEVDDGTESRAN
jgi:trigger factor